MIPIYVFNHADGKHWCVPSDNEVQLSSEILKDVICRIIFIMRQNAYEIKDDLTRSNVAGRCNSYLVERVVSRIIVDGKVVCDMSNNLKETINNNQIVATLWLKLSREEYNLSFSNQPFKDAS